MRINFSCDAGLSQFCFDSDGGGGSSGGSSYGADDAGTGKGTGLAAGYSQAAASLGAAGVSGIGTGGKGSTSGKSTSGGGFGTSNYGDDTSGRSSFSASNGIGAGISSVGDGFSSYGQDGAGTSPGHSAARSGGGTGLSAGYSRAAETMGQAGVFGIGGTFGTGNNPSISPAALSAAYSPLSISMGIAGIGTIGGKSVPTDAFLDAVVGQIIGVESGGRADAKNPKSTATGLGQFTKSTWAATIAAHRPDLAAKYSKAEIAAMRTDPVLSKAMTKAHTLDNANHLAINDVPVTPNSLYAAHFLGRTAAVQAYKADPTTPISDIVSPAAIAANKSVLGNNKSVGQVLGWVDSKMAPVNQAMAMPAPRSTQMTMPQQYAWAGATKAAAPTSPISAATPIPTPAPPARSAFSSFSTHATRSTPVGIPGAVTPTSAFASPAEMAATQRSAENQSMADLATMEAVKSSLSQPTGLSVAQAMAQQEQARAAAELDDEIQEYNSSFWSRANEENPVSPELSGKPAEANEQEDAPAKAKDFADTYLDGPAEKSGKSKSEDGKRSIGSKIGATVVDIGISALSPIAGVGNLLGKAITGKSLGERAVDFIVDLEGPSNGIGASFGQGDDGGINLLPELVQQKQPESKPDQKEAVSDFGIKYLGWRSDTKRPTPREKWGDRTGYGRREYA